MTKSPAEHAIDVQQLTTPGSAVAAQTDAVKCQTEHRSYRRDH